MKLDGILTRRFNNHNSFWQIVYEWEDEIANSLSIPLKYDSNVIVKYALGKFPWLANAVSRSGLAFEMAGHQNHAGYNSCRVLPCVVDWYLREDEELSIFYNQYKNNPAVLISSLEAFDFLKKKDCPLKIFHWPLSIPTKYCNLTVVEKKFDAVIMGRCSPILLEWLMQYGTEHREFTFVTRKKVGDAFVYCASNGMVLGPADSRAEYLNIMRQCRVGLYSTPSVDGLELERTKGFNQITPRFLEYLACGCHVISRYVQNSDSLFYAIDSASTSVKMYEDFSLAMSDCLSRPFDAEKSCRYLQQHSTAARVGRLTEILNAIA